MMPSSAQGQPRRCARLERNGSGRSSVLSPKIRAARADDAEHDDPAGCRLSFLFAEPTRGAGTKRYISVEQTRSLAGFLDTNESADFQGKHGRECARIYA